MRPFATSNTATTTTLMLTPLDNDSDECDVDLNEHINLNADVWALIFKWLDVKSLQRVSQVCRRWYASTAHESIFLWRSLFTRLYPATIPASARDPKRYLGQLSYKTAVLHKPWLLKERLFTNGPDKIVVTPHAASVSDTLADGPPPFGDSPFRHGLILDLSRDAIAWAPAVDTGYVCFGFLSRLRNAGGLAGVATGDYIEMETPGTVTGLVIGDYFVVISLQDDFRVFRKGSVSPDFVIPFYDEDEEPTKPYTWSLVRDVLTVVWAMSAIDDSPSRFVAMWDLGVLTAEPDSIVMSTSLSTADGPSSPTESVTSSMTSGGRPTVPTAVYFESEVIPHLHNVHVVRDNRKRLVSIHAIFTEVPNMSTPAPEELAQSHPSTSQSPAVSNRRVSSAIYHFGKDLSLDNRIRRTWPQMSKVVWASIHDGGRIALYISSTSNIESRWLRLGDSCGNENEDDFPVWNHGPTNIDLGQIHDVHVSKYAASISTDCIKGQDAKPRRNLLYLRRSSPRLRVVDLLTCETVTSFRFAANLSVPANVGLIRLEDEGVYWVADNGDIRFRSRCGRPSASPSANNHHHRNRMSPAIYAARSSAAFPSRTNSSSSIFSSSSGSSSSSSGNMLYSSPTSSRTIMQIPEYIPSPTPALRLHARTRSKPAPPVLNISTTHAIRVGGGGGLSKSGKSRTKKEWKLRMTHRKGVQSSRIGIRPVIGIEAWDEDEIYHNRFSGSNSNDDEEENGNGNDQEDQVDGFDEYESQDDWPMFQEQALLQVQELFPPASQNEAREALELCEWDVEETVDHLLEKEREMEVKKDMQVTELCLMFPGLNIDIVKGVVQHVGGDIDAAVSVLIEM